MMVATQNTAHRDLRQKCLNDELATIPFPIQVECSDHRNLKGTAILLTRNNGSLAPRAQSRRKQTFVLYQEHFHLVFAYKII